jgi:hypothetical protein
MKWIAAGFLLLATAAQAATPSEMTTCSLKADLYASAAQMRDQGQPPQEAAKWLSSYKGAYISSEAFKNVINAVYFDERFAQAGGPLFKKQMLDECLNGPQAAWKPLQ